MFTGESIIFKYAVNDKLAGITAFHQVGVVSSERFVIPRHVRIPLHLVHVKLCPEEAAQAFIVVQRSFINLCLTEIFLEEIDISQLSPVPPSCDRRRWRISDHHVLDLSRSGGGGIVSGMVAHVNIEGGKIV